MTTSAAATRIETNMVVTNYEVMEYTFFAGALLDLQVESVLEKYKGRFSER